MNVSCAHCGVFGLELTERWLVHMVCMVGYSPTGRCPVFCTRTTRRMEDSKLIHGIYCLQETLLGGR